MDKTETFEIRIEKGRSKMAKLYINEKNKKGHINPELYGNFSEHLEDVSMRDFM